MPGIYRAAGETKVFGMPATLRVAVGLLWVQFVAMAGLLIFFVSLVVRQPTDLGWYVTLFGVALTVAFFACARMLQRGRLFGRGAAVALQLLLLAPVYYMISGGFWLGWVLASVIAVVLVLLFMPSTSQALN